MYKLNLIVGIVACTVLTFVSEKLIAVNYTRACDSKK